MSSISQISGPVLQAFFFEKKSSSAALQNPFSQKNAFLHASAPCVPSAMSKKVICLIHLHNPVDQPLKQANPDFSNLFLQLSWFLPSPGGTPGKATNQATKHKNRTPSFVFALCKGVAYRALLLSKTTLLNS
ncbi:MAG: hypothetical protein ACQEWD_16060 [Bacteroidota bacterium]